MIIKSRHVLFLALFSLFFSTELKAQEINESQSLTTIVQTIQDQYDYQFNYAEDIIEGIEIKPPSKKLSFQNVLDYLKNETGLF